MLPVVFKTISENLNRAVGLLFDRNPISVKVKGDVSRLLNLVTLHLG